MSNDRHGRALLLHVLGWVVVIATALIARSDATGWLPSLGVVFGTLLFVGLITRSGVVMVESIRAADRVPARVCRHARRTSVPTWPSHRGQGTTTIRPRRDIAPR